jgi:O-antigen ligase
MRATVSRLSFSRNEWVWLGALAVLLSAVFLGLHPSVYWLGGLIAGLVAVILLRRPVWGFFALIVAALLVPLDIPTGTEVRINLAALLPPIILGVGLLDQVRQREKHPFLPSITNKPLWLFLLAGLLSLLVGTVLWDPAVPRSGNLIIVQLAQWAIFAFSAIMFWGMGSMLRHEAPLQRLTFFFLAVAGTLAIVRVLPGTGSLTERVATFAVDRAPFWLLLAALTGGQLLFNQNLSTRWRWFLLAVLAAVLFYSLVLERATLSNLAGVGPVLAMLIWLRWPRLRRAFVALAVLALLFLLPDIYNFAGGDAEWEESGGSRLALAGRVVEVTMRNPITGLGPAAYRAYTRMKPLLYERAYYLDPAVNSHNNYVDLFAHVGILGLILFFWFSAQVFRLGVRLRAHFLEGFAAGYVNAMLAAWVGALVVMAFADWILPHVYNIGFPGFQASVLVWMFLGGLISLEQVAREIPARVTDDKR